MRYRCTHVRVMVVIYTSRASVTFVALKTMTSFIFSPFDLPCPQPQLQHIVFLHPCVSTCIPFFFSWADSEELWKSMVSKESIYYRTSNYMCRHADLQPRMRSVLLDWIMEVCISFLSAEFFQTQHMLTWINLLYFFVQVCEVYTLHRETFYLAVDYIDRYLSNTKNIHKTRLQLVGVTALFIAAKLEVRLNTLMLNILETIYI